MPQTRGSVTRTRRLGAAVTSAVLAAVVSPVAAHAQDAAGSASSLPTDTGNSSVDELVGVLPEEIVIGGGALGSEGLRDTGSAPVADAGLSLGQVVGSVAPLEAVGSTGGSAAASVASSGSLPGSVYANPTGSLGSGTIGLGSIAIPEYIFPVLSLQFAGGFFTALGERQEAGELYPHELEFWHGLVEGSAAGGALLTDAADAAGTELPGGLAGSIEAVQIAALQDPFEDNERRRAEAQAAAAAEDDATDEPTNGEAGDEPDVTVADGVGESDDDEVTAHPAGADGPAEAGQDGTGPEAATLDAAATPTAGDAAAGPARSGTDEQASPAGLAVTGVGATALAGIAAGAVLLGGLLLAFSRRRA